MVLFTVHLCVVKNCINVNFVPFDFQFLFSIDLK